MQKIANKDLGRLSIQAFKKIKKRPLIIVLDNIRSMNNVGSIFRSCDAFAVEQICLCGITPKPPHRGIEKTALGATSSVDWKYFPTSCECINYIKNQRKSLLCIVEQTTCAIDLDKFHYDLQDSLTLVFGNELSGVGEEFLRQADKSIVINQYGTKHSLNIAVSVGIVLWHIIQQHKDKYLNK